MAARNLETLKKYYNRSAAPSKKGMGGPRRGPGPRAPIAKGKPKNTKAIVSRLMGYIKPYKFTLILVLLFMLITTGSSLAGSYMLRPIINNYIDVGELFSAKEIGRAHV